MNPAKRVLHWGPLSAMAITGSVTVCTMYLSSPWLTRNNTSLFGMAVIFIFLIIACCTLYNLWCAMLIGPGLLPLGWKSKRKNLKFCQICQGYKGLRAHHCSKCNRCVIKMDHHCPWINNCVGEMNQLYFIKFLIFGILTTIQSGTLLSCGLYRAFYIRYYYLRKDDPYTLVHLTSTNFFFTIFNLGLSAGVVASVSCLLYQQLRGYRSDTTLIESLQRDETKREK